MENQKLFNKLLIISLFLFVATVTKEAFAQNLNPNSKKDFLEYSKKDRTILHDLNRECSQKLTSYNTDKILNDLLVNEKTPFFFVESALSTDGFEIQETTYLIDNKNHNQKKQGGFCGT